MLNLDKIKERRQQIVQAISQAATGDQPEAFEKAINDFAEYMQEMVQNEAAGLMQAGDATVLAGRGVRQLTSAEQKYFTQIIEAMRSPNPQQAISSITDVMPKTVIDAVFEDLVAEHPLLDAIGFTNTSGLIEYLVNTNGVETATWGVLTATVVQELTGGFKKINLTLDKLSAFLPIAKSMLDLGPEYMDRYVRAILTESVAYGLEKGIVDGTGKDEPIGMNRQVGTNVVVTGGVYPLKTLVAIASLDPASFATILGVLVNAPNGKKRKISEVLLVCNPADYVSKIFPATTIRGADGRYINDVFPFPTRVIQSVECPEGKAIMGIAKRYFMGIGTAKSGKIEYDDSCKFLEDERVYLVKLYGHGEPLDNNAFVYLDISGLTPAELVVKVSNAADYIASLASLTIGTLSLSPAFDKDTTAYTAATTDATNKITAVAANVNAEIEIKVNGTAQANGAAATWNTGANTVVITVRNGVAVATYTITVTKS